ncbi:hypothetical protein TBS_28320 [Thermobispora bispora]|uniref:Uncharacterized protein n=1 Tax=Thermobispora bispora (strain ATCC 19993 / DSM 43833 / CBS 139.67 / JCM 10125 / KCTC 9307 / NBRC 14880 / R51) TaxID=469371 RepID=D6Y4A8_THEBD|nr:hypothetical protein Tbis_0434 [Thermobispora bispora DSM 43833]
MGNRMAARGVATGQGNTSARETEPRSIPAGTGGGYCRGAPCYRHRGWEAGAGMALALFTLTSY